ncbi:DEAD/DEAH box helicase [Atopomonas sediminilitoris]|uniref:DEAD/DEAH box helicase n=1 Tax=Atopomonas sediminilitoris TaxID=2919919 RepID=UPI001F4E3A6B|nr:DEAD/DEAH box helicase [Atopomonas sediminilitoris]MCJ8167976.1 DEAD/DEAH box helicase [Atopomonas sediminilitoris]
MSESTSGFAALNLHADVLAALNAVGYEEPSPIQAQAIPVILEGHDVIGQAQTGTGKTAAFALPLLSRLNASANTPQALVLVPTRELAIQVATAFEKYASKMRGVKVLAMYGGAPMGPQLKALRMGAQVIVATPGRLCDHLRRDSSLLNGVQQLVLDEADEMLKLGFMDDLEVIFQAMPAARQSVLFSATLPASIKAIAEKHLKQPKHIKIAAKTQTVSRIEQAHVMVHADQKPAVVLRLLEVEAFDALIGFVRTKQATVDMADMLIKNGYRAAALNGDIAQAMREQVVDKLRKGSLDIVIATDVAARGLDVPRITHVLNIDMPYDPESYVHRIGRTGRAGRDGRALLLATPRERRMLQVIERVTNQPVPAMALPGADAVREARLLRLLEQLQPLSEKAEDHRGAVRDELCKRLQCDTATLAAMLLSRMTANQAFTDAELKAEQPGQPQAGGARPERKRNDRNDRPERGERAPRGERSNDRGERGERPRRQREEEAYVPTPGSVRVRIGVGRRDGVQPKNLLGAILNEGGLGKDQVGRITLRDTFSLVELPEQGLAQILDRLKETRVAGKPLKMRRYRED